MQEVKGRFEMDYWCVTLLDGRRYDAEAMELGADAVLVNTAIAVAADPNRMAVAFRQAVEILQSRPNPLVIFPEGEVYHLNQRITPFREGPAAMALRWRALRSGPTPSSLWP